MAKKATEQPLRQMIGEPFKAHLDLKTVEAAIYNIEEYGHRILLVHRNPSGSLKTPSQSRCLHNRAMLSIDVKPGDRQGYAQLCNLCAYETAQLET
jgi:hypothetical protein